MMPNPSILIKLLVVQCLAVLCVAKDFDFFCFVQQVRMCLNLSLSLSLNLELWLQWPGSYCDTRQSCCYPKTGKPAEDFGIHGLWPNYNDGTYPSSCDSRNSFDDSEISDLASRLEKDWPTLACPSGDGLKFWGHEWNKHGTCAESVFDQHSYFQTALDLKSKANLLQALTTAGIGPNGKFYHLESIKEAIREAVGVTPYIECNVDTSGNHQLYQVYMCVDSSGSNFIKCPVLPHSHPCGSKIEFPSFSDNSNSKNDEL